MARLEELLPDMNDIDKGNPRIISILDKIKENEKKGLQYEAAEASFELLVKREFGLLPEFFSIEYFKIIGEQDGNNPSTAVVKINVGGTTELAVSEGNGPVNAIDKALRNALAVFYPVLNEMALSDYKVRIIDSSDATAAITRVLIESTDGVNFWTTVGGSPDIINASVIALTDSILYKLIHPPEAGSDSR
jgi:2-isopropylmalate synthase